MQLELFYWAQSMNEMQVFTGEHSQKMNSQEIADLVEKRHDNVKRTIEALANQGVIESPQVEEIATSTRPANVYVFSGVRGKRDSIIVVAQLSPQFTARLVDRWQELESASRSPTHALPGTYIEALQLLLASEQQKLLIANERDAAVATKAEIGNRREATAMATASSAVRKAEALEVQLDRSKEYATVKRMEMQFHGTAFNWRILKSTAAEMGVPAIDVFDANYGTVKAYHASVWREAYAIDIGDKA